MMDIGEEDNKRATIFNLTSTTLDEITIKLLSNGLKFVPTPTNFNEVEYKADNEDLCDRINSKCNSTAINRNGQQRTNNNKIVKPSFKILPRSNKNKAVKEICSQIKNIKHIPNERNQRNMNDEMYNALEKLKRNMDIVIKEADKGSGVVLMEREFYNNSITHMLQDETTYKPIATTCTAMIDRVQKFTKKWQTVLDKDETKYINNHASSLATIYGLPKIHKSALLKEATRTNNNSLVINYHNPNDLKFRPIISCRSCPSYKLCEVLNNILQLFLPKIHYRLRDTWHFLQNIPTDVPSDTLVITGDISSLYTNITTEKGIEAISYFYDTYAAEIIPARFKKDFIIELFEFCQNHLFFIFEQTTYQQISGTGMGRTYAPAAADIKVGYQEIILEKQIAISLGAETRLYFSQNYWRYLDDIFFLWRTSLTGLNDVKNIMNRIDSNILFTFECSTESTLPNMATPFLDVQVWVKDGKIHTDIYSKDTDTYNYLPFNSCHPRHCARNIPYCLARRIKGIVSDEDLIQDRMEEMKKRLLGKQYPPEIIEDGINKANQISRESIIQGNASKSVDNDAPLYYVSTHNPTVNNNFSSIKSLISGFNATRPNQPSIKVSGSYRRPANLKDHLMFRKTTVNAVSKCGKNCILCKNIKAEQVITLKNGKTIKPNGNFDCTSRNLVYIATCSGCRESYIGETGDTLYNRWSVHRQQSKWPIAEAPVQADIHFRLCGKDNYYVFPFYRPRRNNVNLRRQYEIYFQKIFQPKLNGIIY